jgi:hypothetical protein
VETSYAIWYHKGGVDIYEVDVLVVVGSYPCVEVAHVCSAAGVAAEACYLDHFAIVDSGISIHIVFDHLFVSNTKVDHDPPLPTIRTMAKWLPGELCSLWVKKGTTATCLLPRACGCVCG